MNAKNTIGPIGTNYISLSAGTDSRTILALLRHYHIKHKAISFGKLNMFETDRIKKFAKKYKIPWQLINLEGIENTFDELFYRGTFIYNGLLNPLIIHLIPFYDKIKQYGTRRSQHLFKK